MKIGQFLKKMVGGAMVLTALACPVFTSCYNDAALWDEIEGIHGDVATLEQKLAALEAKLNTDLQALQTLLEGQIKKLEGKVDALVTVKSVKENTDGSVTVTLSDNTEFTVHPKFEQDYTGLVTTTSIDGVLYWAVFDENGKAVAVTDEKGDLVPVVDVVPQVRINPETALVEISFDGGTTWQAVGYNEPCVFEGIEVVYTDNWTDEQETNYPQSCQETPIYVVLTLPDGSTISVTIDGAASFIFGGNMGLIDTQYISYGKTTAVYFMTTNVTDWIKEVPAGWKVEEKDIQNAQNGGAYFSITAPTAEAIASGAAVAEGALKVLAVAEGGKTVASVLKITTKAFNSFAASNYNLNIDVNNGVGAYLVGVSTADAYDPDAIISELKPVVEAVEEWAGGFYPLWGQYFVLENETTLDDNCFDYSVTDYPLEQLSLSTELVKGEQYVVWAVAVNVQGNWYTGMTYEVGSIYSTPYLHGAIELDETKTKLAFNDIEVTVKFDGVDKFFGFFGSMYQGEAPTMDDILSNLQESVKDDEYLTVDSEDGVFVGYPNDLVQSYYYTVDPNTSYYMWLVPRVEGKTEYSAADIYYYEWTTPGFVSGGSLKVTDGEPTATYTQISVPLTAEKASAILHVWVESAKVSTIADKAAYVLENGAIVNGANTTSYSSRLTLKPGMDAVLLALAIDENGAYGELFEKTFTTKPIEYNEDVKFDLAIEGDVADAAKVKVTVTGAPEGAKFHYKHMLKDSYQWTNTWGGSEESASAYFVTAYTYSYTTLNALPEDGLIELTGLDFDEYVFVISCSTTDENGEKVFSKAKVLEFERGLDFGTIVSAKDDNGNENADWAAVKPVVTCTPGTIGDFCDISWTVSDMPEGWTGYTMLVESEYAANYASDKDLLTFLFVGEYDWVSSYNLVNGESYYQTYLYANTSYDIYVVLVDPQGNYYAPYKTQVTTTGGGFGV